MVKTKTLLLTGFEPWAEHASNPSQDFLETVPEFSGWAVSSCLLPVNDTSFQIFQGQIAKVKPDFILSLGLAADRQEISIESCATRGPKMSSGPDRLTSPCLLNEVLRSDDAGDFYCNDIFYLALRAAQLLPLRAAFIHLPMDVKQSHVYDVAALLLSSHG